MQLTQKVEKWPYSYRRKFQIKQENTHNRDHKMQWKEAEIIHKHVKINQKISERIFIHPERPTYQPPVKKFINISWAFKMNWQPQWEELHISYIQKTLNME